MVAVAGRGFPMCAFRLGVRGFGVLGLRGFGG